MVNAGGAAFFMVRRVVAQRLIVYGIDSSGIASGVILIRASECERKRVSGLGLFRYAFASVVFVVRLLLNW